MFDASYRQHYADLGAAFNILGSLPKKDRDILLFNWFAHDDDYDGIGTDDVKSRLTAMDPDWRGRLKRLYAMGL